MSSKDVLPFMRCRTRPSISPSSLSVGVWLAASLRKALWTKRAVEKGELLKAGLYALGSTVIEDARCPSPDIVFSNKIGVDGKLDCVACL